MTTPDDGEMVRAAGGSALADQPALAASSPAVSHPGASAARRLDRRPFVLLAGLALLLAVMVAGIALGSLRIPLADVWTGLFGDHAAGSPYIVWNLRLPRVLLAALVGMNLALAGGILQ